MSLIGLWVYESAAPHSVVYSRLGRFPTVQRRAQLTLGADYVPLPSESTWRDEVVAAVTGVRRDGTLQPSTGREHDWPLLSVGNAPHYPVAVLVDRGLLFVAYPLVADGASTAPALVMPHLHMLREVVKIVQNSRAVGRSFATISLELHNYIAVAAPLGTALNTPVTYAAHLLAGRTGGNAAPAAVAPVAKATTEKVPAWKPASLKSKGGVAFFVDEQARVVQYDNAATPDVCEFFGTLLCNVELEGLVDVSATIATKVHLKNVVTHPCVQSLDVTSGNLFKIRFSPPLGVVKLFSYQIAVEPAVPVIRGFYQMKQIAPDSVKLLVQLKLDAHVNNLFSFCEARIPLTGFPTILRFEATPTAGTLQVEDGHTLVWKIGKMFPKRNLEVALPASVFFDLKLASAAPTLAPADPFLTGTTSHVQVVFKINEHSQSGLNVDNVQAVPNSKFKVSTVQDLSSSSYVIWNSLGKSRSCPLWHAELDAIFASVDHEREGTAAVAAAAAQPSQFFDVSSVPGT